MGRRLLLEESHLTLVFYPLDPTLEVGIIDNNFVKIVRIVIEPNDL